MIDRIEAIEPNKRAQAEKLGYRVELVDVTIDDRQVVSRKYALVSPEGDVIATDFDDIDAAFEALPADLQAQQVAVLKARFGAERATLERQQADERAALARRFDEALAQVSRQFGEKEQV